MSVAGVVGGLALAGLAAAPSTASSDASLFIVQGLPRQSVDIAIDKKQVASGVDGATLEGPFDVAAGEHTVTVSSGGTTVLERTVTVAAGDSKDLVVHLPVQADGDPVMTVFENDVSAVPSDKARVVVAHTAAVVPADIVVDGKVLFANVANGESLDVTVPVDTYEVQIVPTGETEPVVLGPLDLAVKGGSLNRVFAVGDPASDTMRVVTQVIDTADSGSSQPSRVDTGTGGQVAGQSAPTPGGSVLDLLSTP